MWGPWGAVSGHARLVLIVIWARREAGLCCLWPQQDLPVWFVGAADMHTVLCCAGRCWGQREQTRVPALLELTFCGAADSKQDKLVK